MIKSIFISLFLTGLSVALIYSILMLWQQPNSLSDWGVLLATGPSLAYFGWLFLFPVARTAAVAWQVLGLSAIGVLLLGIAGETHPLPWIFALVIGLCGSFAYQLWYSRFGRQSSQLLRVGERLPNLQFEDTNGSAVKTDEITGALLLMFYRGNWCPLCMAQISEVASQYQKLKASGVRTLLISSQPHSNTEALASKFNVDFLYMVDKDNKVARQLNILSPNGTPMGLQVLGYSSDTVMPTVVLTDASKNIIFCDETDNYRVRPEPETFLRLLDVGAATAGTTSGQSSQNNAPVPNTP